MVLAQSDADESAASAAASNSNGSSDVKSTISRSDRDHSGNADDDANAESSADSETAQEAAEAAVALTVPAYLRSVHTLHVQLQRLRGAADPGGDDDDSVYVAYSSRSSPSLFTSSRSLDASLIL